jgi:hypothetical protein
MKNLVIRCAALLFRATLSVVYPARTVVDAKMVVPIRVGLKMWYSRAMRRLLVLTKEHRLAPTFRDITVPVVFVVRCTPSSLC